MGKKKESIRFKDMDNLEGNAFKKDEKSYLIFPCTKCGQYSYVKLTQKGKKCLRCGRTHQVKKIKNLGEIVNGMSAAIEMVKKRQNELAIEKLGGDPDLLTTQSFKKVKEPSFTTYKEGKEESDKYEKFKRVLIKRTKRFSEFPKYVIDILAEEIGISQSEKEKFIKILKDRDHLIYLNNGNFILRP
jgi:transcription elongation factor Elf1